MNKCAKYKNRENVKNKKSIIILLISFFIFIMSNILNHIEVYTNLLLYILRFIFSLLYLFFLSGVIIYNIFIDQFINLNNIEKLLIIIAVSMLFPIISGYFLNFFKIPLNFDIIIFVMNFEIIIIFLINIIKILYSVFIKNNKKSVKIM